MGAAGRPAPLLAVVAMPIMLAASCTGEALPPPDYVEQMEKHRADRETRLRSEDGWLSLIGLYWLSPGENRVGSDPASAVRLPADAAPPHAASLFYENGTVRIEAAAGAGITLDGAPVTAAELTDDAAGEPSQLRLGRLRFHLIARDGRHAVRVRDPESPTRAGFEGIDFFPIDPAYRVRARFAEHGAPQELAIPTVLGTTQTMLAPGVVRFRLRGEDLSLTPLLENPTDTEFFFIFKDGTSGVETYPACRYLYATRDGDEVWLDFNKAYNPPCAFTQFATCPLPPPGNKLPVRIEAGEKAYHAKSGLS